MAAGPAWLMTSEIKRSTAVPAATVLGMLAAGQGSTLFYPGHVTHEFHNETNTMAELYVVVDSTRAC